MRTIKLATELSSVPLLKWYDRHARELPWRISPHDLRKGVRPDPYRVWLSEVMLQQTTVATVRDYFEKFTSKWPDVAALAAASEDDVLRAWAGLGYYSRARNLKKCADVVARDYGGRFPPDIDALRALPGIGDYTAAAIGSIAFGISAAVVDGNVERVTTRLFAIDAPLPGAKPIIKQKVAAMVDPARPGDFAQAMMDLGATLCTPKRPSCADCPWRGQCAAFRSGEQELFPVKAAKKAKPKRVGAAFVIVGSDEAILLEKREANGLLANMAQVPTSDWNSRQDGATDISVAPVANLEWHKAGIIHHVFTHFELALTVWTTTVKDLPVMSATSWWTRIDDIDGEALPTVMKKAIACALALRKEGNS